jgi:hypothetical protein
VGQLNPFGQPDLGGLPDVPVTIDEVPYLIPVGEIAQAIEELVSFFEWLFGGSGAPPNPRKLLHGRHPLYPMILGIQKGLIPDEASAISPDEGSAVSDDSFEEPSGEPANSNAVPAGYVIPVADMDESHDPEFWKKGPWIEPWMLQQWARLRGGRKVIPIRPPVTPNGTNLIDPFPWFFLPGAYCQSLENLHVFDPACGSGGL